MYTVLLVHYIHFHDAEILFSLIYSLFLFTYKNQYCVKIMSSSCRFKQMLSILNNLTLAKYRNVKPTGVMEHAYS